MRLVYSVLTLAASWAGLAQAQQLTTSGTYTGTYQNTTVCKYHYGATSVPATAIPTLPYYNSTTGFSQATRTLHSTVYYTPKPQKTLTLTQVTTSTTFTSTSRTTFYDTNTVTSYTGATVTIPTPSGFTPIGATNLLPIPRTTSATTTNPSAKAGRRAASTPPGPTYPKGTNTFTTALYCTTNPVFKPTSTATVTGTTQTVTRGTVTTTKTVTKTVSEVTTTGIHVTATVTTTTQPKFYQACASNNIVDELRTYNGTVEPINFYYGWGNGLGGSEGDSSSPYACCVSCQNTPGCVGSTWSDASEVYSIYNGYFGYSGTYCQLWSGYFQKCPSPSSVRVPPIYGYDRTKGDREGAVKLSNGACPLNWIKERQRTPQCGYTDDLYCWRENIGPGQYA